MDKTIYRSEYRAVLKQDADEAAFAAAAAQTEALAREAYAREEILALCIYRFEQMLFIYAETLGTPSLSMDLLKPMESCLQLWPEQGQPTAFAPMYPIYWHAIPGSREDWLRERATAAQRVGRIAFLRPGKEFSYIYWHYAIVQEGLLLGDKYQFISLHEQILFSYYEEPRHNVNLTGKNEASKVIEGWMAVDPESHFDHERIGTEANFLVLPAVVMV